MEYIKLINSIKSFVRHRSLSARQEIPALLGNYALPCMEAIFHCLIQKSPPLHCMLSPMNRACVHVYYFFNIYFMLFTHVLELAFISILM